MRLNLRQIPISNIARLQGVKYGPFFCAETVRINSGQVKASHFRIEAVLVHCVAPQSVRASVSGALEVDGQVALVFVPLLERESPQQRLVWIESLLLHPQVAQFLDQIKDLVPFCELVLHGLFQQLVSDLAVLVLGLGLFVEEVLRLIVPLLGQVHVGVDQTISLKNFQPVLLNRGLDRRALHIAAVTGAVDVIVVLRVDGMRLARIVVGVVHPRAERAYLPHDFVQLRDLAGLVAAPLRVNHPIFICAPALVQLLAIFHLLLCEVSHLVPQVHATAVFVIGFIFNFVADLQQVSLGILRHCSEPSHRQFKTKD